MKRCSGRRSYRLRGRVPLRGWIALTVAIGLLAGCSGQGSSKESEAAGHPAESTAKVGAEKGVAQVAPESSATASAESQQQPQSGATPVRPNRPPVARFEVRPLTGYAAMTDFAFDASFSTDDTNISGEMSSRWDYDGDGTWDTPFTRAARMSHVFPDPGTYHPRVEARDTGGLTSTADAVEVVVKNNCPAPDFALVDTNPNSATFGKTYQLSDYRGRRVVLWLAAPSH